MKVLAAFFVNALFNFLIGLMVAKFLGPEEYGRFALALALGFVVQAFLFDWIRLSAIRFYSARTRAEEPDVRATLDAGFAILALSVALAGAGVLLIGGDLGLSHALIGLALAASIANGLFDYSTGLVRASFNDALYTRLVLVKNVLSLALTTGGAFVFGSAQMALFGAVISIAGSILIARRPLTDSGSEPRFANYNRARAFLAYSAPIVTANLLYILIPLVNRALAARYYGFAETGQFSLAFDLGLRALQAVGSALDVLLFQIAVAARDTHGPERGRAQIGRNIAIVLAVIAPATAGVLFTLPSVEALAAPPEFRGPFGHYLTLMLPGLAALVLILFAINPIFQLENKTLPMIGAALIGAAGTPVILAFLPKTTDASALALAQSGAYLAALAALVAFAAAAKPRWPPARDFLGIAVALAAMCAALWPLRALAPGALALVTQMTVGAGVYGAVALAFDVAGLRGPLIDKLRALARRG